MAGISDLFYGHPSGAMTVVGVTGTNGKTTTTYLLESIVKAAGGRPAVAGTIENRLNGERLEKSINTTPISLTSTKLMAKFRDGGATHALLEVSSHALALKRVENVDFDACIYLNLTRDHLDFHKTVDAYFDAKARLFDLLARAGNKKSPKVAALNFDDPRAHLLVKKAVDCEVIRFGLTDAATELKGKIRKADLNGTIFEVTFRGKRYDASVRLPGVHNVENAMAAAAAMLGLRTAPETVLDGIAALRAVPGRLESISEGQDFHVFVDYAHTDSALETILALLRSLPHKRIITVVGCGGDRDKGKRGPMGIAACRGGDLAIFTSDNPRSEAPSAILADIEAGVRAAGLQNYRIEPDRGVAIAAAIAEARSGDVVLIAGKGHEDYQILADRTISFDDRVAAREALKSLK
jgi:UDP-N-acetylmuramoyl-L-alanyl-D-glutamate--2,6-diaminopimelate ligase